MHDLDVALLAAHAAADVIRRASDRTPSMKGTVDPVTETDTAAESAILAVLAEHRPEDPVVAEESGGSLSEGRLWVVDPLDGTVNFVHGIDQVAVTIALCEGGRPVVGVTLDVYRGLAYTATRGGGAWVGSTRLRVTDRPTSDAVVASGYPYDRRERADLYADFTGRMLKACRGVRRFGAAALDLAWVAEGRVDAYMEPGLPAGVKPWDVAAGMLLVQEAGGEVLNLHGEQAGLEESLFIAGGPRSIAGLVEAVAGWGQT